MDFFGSPSPPPAPIITAPPVMPTPDDKAVKDARRRSLAMQLSRRGRASTIDTQGAAGGDTLGA